MEENKPINNSEDAKPPNNPQDAVHEQQLNNASTDETIVPAETTAESEQPQIINLSAEALAKADYKPETEDMEVHHHTHASHGKKNWKSYFWEFLMLFLAVFCGFLAEYQLEHKIERDRELQFIKSLTTDLQDDAKSLNAMIVQEHQGIKSLDTLIDLLNNPQFAKQHGDGLYYVARIGPRTIPFANNSRTFDQLKNSGGFRLIRKTEASNNIMGYYNQFSLIRLMEDNYNHEFDNFKKIAAKILDPAILRRQEADNGNIERSTDNPSLRTYDIEMLKEMAFHTLHMNGTRRSRVLLFEKLKASAEELTVYLKKEYHLE